MEFLMMSLVIKRLFLLMRMPSRRQAYPVLYTTSSVCTRDVAAGPVLDRWGRNYQTLTFLLLIFLKCSDLSHVWHAYTSTSTRPNCLLSHCKHETISRVWVSNSVSNIFCLFFGGQKWLACNYTILADRPTLFLLVLVLVTSVAVLEPSLVYSLPHRPNPA